MSQLKHVQSALGWCLIGLLLTYLIINVIGFISPFWGHWLHPEDPGASLRLLHLWQPITPWFAVCFAVAAWHLAMTCQAIAARVCIIAMGALVPVAHIGSGFARRAMEQAASPVPPQLPAAMNMLANAYLGFTALAFIALIWRAVRQSNNSFKPNLLRSANNMAD